MAEAIAIGLAVDGAKAVTTAIIARAVEEIRLASWGFKDHLEKLKERLLYIQAFLEDTGSAKQAEKSQLVNRWLQKLVDVAYSADDVMNDYAYEMLRRKVELKNKFRKFFTPTTNPVLFRCHISCRVSKILSELDDLDKDAKFIGLQPVQLAREAVAPGSSYQRNDKLDQVREHADAIGSEFIGRKLDKEKLLPMLLNPTAKEGLLSIVAIIGIGGVGKTTLARRLYEDQKVNEHFRKKKMWICVSEDFNVERLLKEMVESLTSTTKCDLANTDAIIKKLQGELKGERYLLVLDDVWNKNQELWDSLKNVLLKISALEGSVILFTTREIEVLKKSRASYSHELKGLSEDDGWALLKHKVFSDIFPYFHSFEDIGKRIVRRCKFVPLAIKSIGGLLQSKKTVSEWEEIAKSELWELQFEDENYIMPSLLLSYNHLPNASVKQCFAYCAIFPKDELMQKSELMALWLAQGFLQETSETSSSTSTNNAENYFAMLVNYSFLQASQVQEESYGYQMHDLVHDLANYVLKRDLLVCKVEAIPEDASTSHIRYLIFNLERDEIAPELPAMQKLKTIMFWGGVPRWESLLCARYMHTLIIAGIGIKLVPSVIGKLVHLRYLDLSNNAFAALPESICKLYQLQTLRLLNCVKLKDLPTQLCRLVNLIHIPTTGPLYASRGIRQLTRLQTLPRLKLHDRDQGWTINELELLNEVEGEIYISGLQHVKNKEDATKASLGSKNQMLELDLRWDSKDDDVLLGIDNDVLGGLEPHSNVKSLTIIGFNGITFPCWIMMMAVKQGRGNSIPLSNLTEIELRGCRRCQQLPTLGKLRSLRILMLNTFDDVECIGAEFYQRSIDENNGSEFHASEKEEVLFPALTEFHIVDFKKLKAWMPPALSTLHAFPCLETLKIRKCYNLKTVPTQHFRSLKHLELGDLGGTQPFDIIKHNSHGLISLSVKGMEEMELPNCPNLEHLDIRSCQHMKSISSSALIFLQTLIIDNCPSLVYIPDGFSSLRHLQIRNCEVLERIPLNLEDCTSLENLTIHNCPLIKGSGRDLGKLHGLRYLCLVNSGKMTSSWPQWIQQLHRLSYLVISGVDEDNGIYMTTPLPLTLVSNKSLTFLHLIGGSREHEYLPPQLAQCSFPGLQRLTITGFVQLKRLPEWIGNFTSLEALQLARCANLEFLPSQEAMQHLSKLESLSTFRCPLLKARCAEGEGSEWPKISRIRNINIQ
ncbi:hypothetical protein BVRB_1g020250 [Beta vulgaris subsp. vulgaris]|nr:hypothetical protein BVRB_1g020250 [Beta vulgaris subsp. vulgaris]